VKGTATASLTAPRLTVDVGVDSFNRLVRLTVPTYLAAVDLSQKQVYLVAAHRRRKKAVSSVPKSYPLSRDAVKIDLHREVTAFWAPHLATRRTSRFSDV
jgi:hypothetical protein